MENKVVRFYQCEVRSANDEEHGDYIEGSPIVFRAITDIGYFDEVIDDGALDNADLRDVPLFVNHNSEMIPLARSRRNNSNSTMQLIPTENGMNFRANLDTENNSTARELKSAVDRGDIDGMSFAFSVDTDEWENLDSDHPTRHIKSISKVYEISAVTFPAYPQTSIYMSRSEADRNALENARGLLENKRAEQRAEQVKRLKEMLKEI